MQSLITECAVSPENSLVMMLDCFHEPLGWGVYCHRAVRRGLVMTPLVTDLCRNKQTPRRSFFFLYFVDRASCNDSR